MATFVFLATGILVLLTPGRGASAHGEERVRFRAVGDFGPCIDGYLAAPEECLQVLAAFVKAHPAQAFVAGKAVRAKLTHAAAIPFFAQALAKTTNESPDRSRCADEDVAMALISGLDRPARGGTTAQALVIFLDKCWPETQAAVSTALSESGPSSYLAQNLCPKLAERGLTNASCTASSVRKPAGPASVTRSPANKQTP